MQSLRRLFNIQDESVEFAQAAINKDEETVQQLLKSKAIKTWINYDVSLENLSNHGYSKDMKFITPLGISITFCSLDIVKQLIVLGARLQKINGLNDNALIFACHYKLDRLEKVRYLVKLCPESVNESDELGYNPMYVAVIHDDHNFIEELVSHGADVNKISKGGLSPLYVASAMSHSHCVRVLLKTNVDSTLKMKTSGQKAIHIAALNGNNDVLAQLIEHGDDVNDVDRTHAATPLHLATSKGNVDCVTLLLKANADTCLVNKDGFRPMHDAVRFDQPQVVARLIEFGDDVNATCAAQHDTPLHIAATKGHLDCVTLLLKANADTSLVNKLGFRPIHSAVYFDRPQVLARLIEFNDNVHAREVVHNDTPMHIAAAKGHLDCVTLLLKANADTNLVNKKGARPIHYAVYCNWHQLVAKLIEFGDDVNAMAGSQTVTPLHIAASRGNFDCVTLLLQANGDDVDVVEKRFGSTPLCLAARKGHLNCVVELLKANADFELPDYFGYRPMHLAALQGNVNVVAQLYKHGVDINTRISAPDYDLPLSPKLWSKIKSTYTIHKNRTPLHIAVNYNHPKVVSLLLSYENCDVHAKDDHGETPSDIAKRRGLTKILEIIDSAIKYRASKRESQPYVEEAIDALNLINVEVTNSLAGVEKEGPLRDIVGSDVTRSASTTVIGDELCTGYGDIIDLLITDEEGAVGGFDTENMMSPISASAQTEFFNITHERANADAIDKQSLKNLNANVTSPAEVVNSSIVIEEEEVAIDRRNLSNVEVENSVDGVEKEGPLRDMVGSDVTRSASTTVIGDELCTGYGDSIDLLITDEEGAVGGFETENMMSPISASAETEFLNITQERGNVDAIAKQSLKNLNANVTSLAKVLNSSTVIDEEAHFRTGYDSVVTRSAPPSVKDDDINTSEIIDISTSNIRDDIVVGGFDTETVKSTVAVSANDEFSNISSKGNPGGELSRQDIRNLSDDDRTCDPLAMKNISHTPDTESIIYDISKLDEEIGAIENYPATKYHALSMDDNKYESELIFKKDVDQIGRLDLGNCMMSNVSDDVRDHLRGISVKESPRNLPDVVVVDLLRHHTKLLINNVDPEELLDDLMSRKILSGDEYGRISNISDCRRCMRQLMATLFAKKSALWAPVFIDLLRNNPETKNIADEIESTDHGSIARSHIY